MKIAIPAGLSSRAIPKRRGRPKKKAEASGSSSGDSSSDTEDDEDDPRKGKRSKGPLKPGSGGTGPRAWNSNSLKVS